MAVLKGDTPADLADALDLRSGAREIFARLASDHQDTLIAFIDEARDEGHRRVRVELVVTSLHR